MGISAYMKNLRSQLGTQLLLCPSVAALVRNEAGQFLFLLRSDNGRWDLPAGAVDPGETPAQAVVREVREETGLIVKPTAIAGVLGGPGFRLRYDNGDVVEYTVVVFECQVIGGELAALDGEAVELRFIDAAERPPLTADFPDELFARPSGGPVLFH